MIGALQPLSDQVLFFGSFKPAFAPRLLSSFPQPNHFFSLPPHATLTFIHPRIITLQYFSIQKFLPHSQNSFYRFVFIYLFLGKSSYLFVATSSAKWNCGFFFKIAVRLRWNVSGRRKESSSWFVGNKNDDNLYVLHGRASRIELWRERVPAEKELSVCMRSTGIKAQSPAWA